MGMARNQDKIADLLFVSSLPFIAFAFSAFDIRLPIQFQLFLFLASAVLFSRLYKNRAWLNGPAKEPLCVLILYILVFLFVFRTFSPFYNATFFQGWGRLDYLLNLEHQWKNAKAFDFLGNFNQFSKLGGYTQAQFLLSELSALIVWIFDIPLVDIFSKYDTIKFMFFSLFIFASYGFYLFLRHGVKLAFLPSFIGGLGYILGNTSLIAFYGCVCEYAMYFTCFIFFPWVLLFLKLAHDFDKPSLVCFAGLFASLAEYAVSSHPESEGLFIFFCNVYNVYLSGVRLRNDRFEKEAIKRFFKFVFLFPVFHFIGLSYRLIPLFHAMAVKEFALFDSVIEGGNKGLWWAGTDENNRLIIEHYFHLFFGIEDVSQIGALSWQRVANGGVIIPWYTGQFMIFMIFSLICSLLFRAFRRSFVKKGGGNPRLKHYIFFLVMYLLLASNLPIGNSSLISKLMAATKFLRLHEFYRTTMFYSFFALTTAMCGLDYMLKLRRAFRLNVIFLVYLLTLLLVFLTLSPLRVPVTPDTPGKGAGILLAIWIALFLSRKTRSLLENRGFPGYQWVKNLSGLLLVAVALYSFITINKHCYQFIMEFKNLYLTKENIHTSFRTAVTELRNNPHDQASIEYLERRLDKFVDDIDDATWRRKDFGKSREILKQIKSADQRPENRSERITHKLDLFSKIAPEIDDYYPKKGKLILFTDAIWDLGVLSMDSSSTSFAQFYLPDKYQLSAYLSSESSSGLAGVLPLGKNSELSGVAFYGIQQAYPLIDINFYFKAIYSSLRSKIGMIVDYNFKGLGINDFVSIKNEKKLFNVMGVDYIFFHNHVFNQLPSPSETWQSLLSMGLEPVSFPETYKLSDDRYNAVVFKNPESYGKAYVARWVKTIAPEENIFNQNIFDLPRHWPLSEELLDHFNSNIAKIPEDIWRSAIIESSNLEDRLSEPRTYTIQNRVEVVKIIGSKAVFDVDCADENCWMIYNTAALKGWEAFSGSTPIPIHKANLGFIGVKLSKGKHFVWMEYRPTIRNASFIIMVVAWILVLAKLMTHLPFMRTGSVNH